MTYFCAYQPHTTSFIYERYSKNVLMQVIMVISMQKQRDRHLHIILIVTLGIRYLQLLTDLSTEGSTVSLGLRQNIAMQ